MSISLYTKDANREIKFSDQTKERPPEESLYTLSLNSILVGLNGPKKPISPPLSIHMKQILDRLCSHPNPIFFLFFFTIESKKHDN